MHLCEDNVIVEVVRDGRPAEPGEEGEVLITGLHSYMAPFIRYAIGDIVTRGDANCRCGAPFATIRHVRGRVMDYCRLPDGRLMHHWELIPMTFWDMPLHCRYQLLQHARNRIVLRMVLSGRPPARDLESLQAAIQHKVGAGVNFRFEFVNEIALESSGKRRLCRSEVA